jgi:hypothetical protein
VEGSPHRHCQYAQDFNQCNQVFDFFKNKKNAALGCGDPRGDLPLIDFHFGVNNSANVFRTKRRQ